MQKYSRIALLALAGLFAIGTACAEDQPVAAPKVNGIEIPQERIDANIEAAIAQGQQDTPELRAMVRDRMIDLEVMSQEAEKAGMDKRADVQQQIIMTRQNVLAGALLQEYVKNNPITDADLKKGYDDLKQSLGGKELDIRHILVKTEDEAKKIESELKKGKDFAKLAKEKSQDAGSKNDGGDLGWVPAGNVAKTYVKPFADAALALKKGEISAPVESQFGWHVIQLADERDLKLPTMDELKPKIEQRMQREAVQNYITDLRGKAKIE